MAVYLSPGVFVNEIDLSAFASQGSDVIPAFVGTAQKGPINDPQLITTAEQFVEVFGEPFSDSFLGYAVLAFLEEGTSCWVNRVVVECEDGQPTELSTTCVDVSGAKEQGWARIPLFSGVDFGRICTKVLSSDDPLVFHAASTTTPIFTDVEESSSDGATAASMALSGTYTGAIDDSFIVLITGAPTSGVLDGATYDVLRNSDGETVSSGTLVDAGGGISSSFAIGSGDEASGLTAVITVSGSSPLESGDHIVFNAAPDNRTFAFAVEGDATPNLYQATGTYTDADTFADYMNTLAGSGEDYIAVAKDDGSVCVRTDVAGRWIQLVATEAFALEIGVQKWAYDIPRSHIVAQDSGPYNINTTNNRVKVVVVSDLETVYAETSLTSSSVHTAATLVSELDAGSIVEGIVRYDAVELQVTDDDTVVVLMTTTSNDTDNIALIANSSNPKTLRFAQEMQIPFPYGSDYRVFTDSRLVLPEQGVVDPSTPLSCETAPMSNECADDSAYYAAIVGYLVAQSAGTWANGYTVKLSVYNNTSGRYTLRVFDDNGIEVERIDDLSFDPSEARYIGNIVNPGSALGGISGSATLRWEERPTDLANDSTDPSYEVRIPGTFSSMAFSGGLNGIPDDPIYSGEIDAAILGIASESTGIFAFQNSELYDIDLLLTPGVATGSVIAQALAMAESRGDLVYLVDPPFGLRPSQVIDWHNGMLDSSLTSAINSSYGALYWGWQKVFDQFSREEIYIPPSGMVSAVFGRTSRVGERWFAPAGLQRGRLLTSLDVEYNPSQGERDQLYGLGNAVNPIVKFPQDGIVVFGQRTLQRADTALNRVNVRMLLNFLKKRLVRLLRNYIFEPNDDILRATVKANVEPLLREVASRRGITAFKVVVDETNNTPQRIDNNELWVSVFIQPTKAAEFIRLNMVVLRTEQSFSAAEVLQAGGVISVQQ